MVISYRKNGLGWNKRSTSGTNFLWVMNIITWSPCLIMELLFAIITSSPRTIAPIVVPGGNFISSTIRPTTFEVLSSP